jgi:hypothetical protein
MAATDTERRLALWLPGWPVSACLRNAPTETPAVMVGKVVADRRSGDDDTD